MTATTRTVLTVEQYLAEVLAQITPLSGAEPVPLREAAGRTLAEPVFARGDVPAFANSAMDGFAIRGADATPGAELSIVGEVFAGSQDDPMLERGEAIRIMTGAPLPTAADTVIPVEQVIEVGTDRIRLDAEVRLRQHVRGAGEDVRAGDEVLTAGTVLGPRTLAAAAAAGAGTLSCVRRPWVGVIATGDELVAPGQPLRRGQIYESNATFLGAALARDGAAPLVAGAVEDTAEALTAALDTLAARCDLIVVSGGVSVGDADVTRIVLEGAGAQFRHVRMQPGKPQGWARWGARRIPVICLPGNPLSAAVSYEMFVSAALDRLLDRPHLGWSTAVATAAWSSPAGRRQIVPVLLDVDASGRQSVKPAHRRGSASHMVTSLVSADALAAVGEDISQVQPGDLLTVRRLP